MGARLALDGRIAYHPAGGTHQRDQLRIVCFTIVVAKASKPGAPGGSRWTFLMRR